MLQRKPIFTPLALVWVAVGLQCQECWSRPVPFATEDPTRAAATEGSASKPSVSITEKNSTKFDAMESSQSQLSEVENSAVVTSAKPPNFVASLEGETIVEQREMGSGTSQLNAEKSQRTRDKSVPRSRKSKRSDQPKRLARDALRKVARKKRSSQVKKAAPADGAASLKIVEEDPTKRDLNSKQTNATRTSADVGKQWRAVANGEKSTNKTNPDLHEQKRETSSKGLKKKSAEIPKKNENNRKSKKAVKNTVEKSGKGIEDAGIEENRLNREDGYTKAEETRTARSAVKSKRAAKKVKGDEKTREDEIESSVNENEIESSVDENEIENSVDENEIENSADEIEIGNAINENEVKNLTDENDYDDYEDDEEIPENTNGDQTTDIEETEAEYDYEDEASIQQDTNADLKGEQKDEEFQAHPADVEVSPANKTARFSNNKPGSTDVTPTATNEKPLLIEHNGDVPRSLGGVGGKSMNENLQAMFGAGHPPRVSILGKCNLQNISLKMECRGNMISICSSNSFAHPVKVWIEGGEGTAEITRLAPMAFAQLHIATNDTAVPRWKVSGALEESAASSECPDPALHSPVLIVKASNSACRVLVNCTCRKDEVFIILTDGGTGPDTCDDQPLLYAGMSLNRGDGTRLQPKSPVNLGATIQLRVEAEAALGGSSLATKLKLRRGQRTQDAGLDLHLHKCWVGGPGHERALLVQDGCSMVEILQNFAEKTELAFKLLQMNNSFTPNAGIYKPKKQSGQENFIENGTLKENESLKTRLKSHSVTSRVVQSSSLVVFIMDMSDKTIDITCQVKLCVDECLESPTCVDSSVNVDRGQRVRLPPVYSVVRTLTVSMTPNINGSGTSSSQEQVRKARSISSFEVDAPASEDVETLANGKTPLIARNSAAVQEAQSGSFVVRQAEGEGASGSNVSKGMPWISYSDPNLVDPHAESGNCVPWWLYFVSLAVLTITYIIALVACVCYLSNEPAKQGTQREEALHTPSRPYYVDQCSARKRSPPSLMERNMY